MVNPEHVRDGWIALAESLPDPVFVTFLFNRRVSAYAAERDFLEFCRRLERKGHGSRWESFPEASRLKALGGLEDLRDHPHAHALFTGSPRLKATLRAYAPDIWRTLTRCGEAVVEPAIRTRAGAARYPFKYILGDERQSHVLVYGAPKLNL